MSPAVYFSRPQNLACHNFCRTIQPPTGLSALLGLGHKFCIERARPPSRCVDSMARLRRSVRLRHWINNNPESSPSEHIPGLHEPSQWEPPPIHEGNLELRLMDFASQIKTLSRSFSHRRRHCNLSPLQHHLLRKVKDDKRFIVCLTDKNLGPAIME